MKAATLVAFTVDGTPIPQGSKTAFVVKGRAVMTDQNAKVLKPWRAAVTAAAKAAHSGPPIDGPVVVAIVFRFVRPKSVRRDFPSVKPDLDKTVRACWDAITDAGVWRDDSQVVLVHARKVYAERAGMDVRIGMHKEENQ